MVCDYRPVPDHQSLAEGLASVFQGSEYSGCPFSLTREDNPYSSTFPSQIVMCRFDDGRTLRLLCKFEAGRDEGDVGHRRGLRYEAAVYQSVLQPLQAPVPRFYGAYQCDSLNNMWVAIEYIEDGIRVHKAEEPMDAILSACRWAGRFHADAERLLSSASLPFLVVHDSRYYLKWARRTAISADRVRDRFPWLVEACRRFEAIVPLLTDSRATLIHGEYYPDNILVREGNVYPVDWQSAAVAAGEIDLAVITSGDWPPDVVHRCVLEYQRARWPYGPPDDFARRLAAARIHWCMLFIGDTPDTGPCEEDFGFITEMRDSAVELGLI